MVGKSQIVDRVAAVAGTRAQAALVVDAVLEAVTAELAAGERVTLVGFGTFEPIARPARTVRNPRTGAAVEVDASVAARFRPGAGLRAALAGTSGAPVDLQPTAPAVRQARAVPKAPTTAVVETPVAAATKAAVKPATKDSAKSAGKTASKPVAKPAGKDAAKAKAKVKPAKADAKAASKGKKKKKR